MDWFWHHQETKQRRKDVTAWVRIQIHNLLIEGPLPQPPQPHDSTTCYLIAVPAGGSCAAVHTIAVDDVLVSRDRVHVCDGRFGNVTKQAALGLLVSVVGVHLWYVVLMSVEAIVVIVANLSFLYGASPEAMRCWELWTTYVACARASERAYLLSLSNFLFVWFEKSATDLTACVLEENQNTQKVKQNAF